MAARGALAGAGHLAGSPVYVSSDGRLGVLASSERYKTGVAALNDPAARLRQLRPVSYRLKEDADSGEQFGLIAEEVDRERQALVTQAAELTALKQQMAALQTLTASMQSALAEVLAGRTTVAIHAVAPDPSRVPRRTRHPGLASSRTDDALSPA